LLLVRAMVHEPAAPGSARRTDEDELEDELHRNSSGSDAPEGQKRPILSVLGRLTLNVLLSFAQFEREVIRSCRRKLESSPASASSSSACSRCRESPARLP
jgi:hypothetical protein